MTTTTAAAAQARGAVGAECFDCGVRGHKAMDCLKKKKERALLADIEEEAALL